MEMEKIEIEIEIENGDEEFYYSIISHSIYV
jgi:hypothetical protein